MCHFLNNFIYFAQVDKHFRYPLNGPLGRFTQEVAKSVCCMLSHFLVNWRPLVKECMANIG